MTEDILKSEAKRLYDAVQDCEYAIVQLKVTCRDGVTQTDIWSMSKDRNGDTAGSFGPIPSDSVDYTIEKHQRARGDTAKKLRDEAAKYGYELVKKDAK